MQVELTENQDVVVFAPERFCDPRSSFMETYQQDVFSLVVPNAAFVQHNHSLSARCGTVRGLHDQRESIGQGKLFRVMRRAVLDFTAEVRGGSPTCGHHVAVELSAKNARQLWVPVGFLCGFSMLTDNAEVLCKVTNHYNQPHESDVLWNDPDLGIRWPDAQGGSVLSDKDGNALRIKDVGELFSYRSGGA